MHSIKYLITNKSIIIRVFRAPKKEERKEIHPRQGDISRYLAIGKGVTEDSLGNSVKRSPRLSGNSF